MKRSTIAIVVACMATLFACEQTVDVELPYEKKIVINVFIGRDTNDLAWISKTQPVGTNVTIDNSAIPNADVKIYWRDTVYQCTFVPERKGYTLPPWDDRWQGDSLRITVDWEGLYAEASGLVVPKARNLGLTFVPDRFDTTYGSLRANATVAARTINWWELLRNSFYIAPLTFYFYTTASNSTVDSATLSYGTYQIFSRQEVESLEPIEVSVYSADIDFERYLKDRNAGNDGPFSNGGINPYFNVKGDGIGMFVPVTVQREFVPVWYE